MIIEVFCESPFFFLISHRHFFSPTASYSVIHSKAAAGPITGSALLIFINKNCVEKVAIEGNKNVETRSNTTMIVCVCLDTSCLPKYQLSLLLM